MMSSNLFSLKGKTILITGSAGGIGSATAHLCVNLGARVILTDIRQEALKDTFNSLPDFQEREPLYFAADLTNSDELAALVDFCPQIDGLVCNAGVMKLTLTQFIKEEELIRIQKINLNAPILLTKSLLKKKKINKGGSIVYTASAAGVFRVSIGNSVNPGMVETALIGSFTEEEKANEIKNYPLGRFAKPEDIAYGIAYLLSEAAAFVTGTALKIDGGMTLS